MDSHCSIHEKWHDWKYNYTLLHVYALKYFILGSLKNTMFQVFHIILIINIPRVDNLMDLNVIFMLLKKLK